MSDYFARIGVAGIELTGDLAVGDAIHIKDHTTDLNQAVESMQIEREAVESAGAGDSIGIKLSDRCRSRRYRLPGHRLGPQAPPAAATAARLVSGVAGGIEQPAVSNSRSASAVSVSRACAATSSADIPARRV